jgi:hypothetical protein
MAQHKVNVGGSVPTSSATGAGGSGGQTRSDVDEPNLDVSHLRPVSEGVLRRVGLHGGANEDGSVRDMRNQYGGAFDLDPDTLPSNEPHVQLLRLQHQTGGIVERNTNADGSITLSLTHGDGDVTTFKAQDDKAALAGLIAKMGSAVNASGGTK